MKKPGIIKRMINALIKKLCILALCIVGVLALFLIILGSEYSFSLKRSAIVYKQQKSMIQKYMGGVKVLKYIVKIF